MALIWGRNPVVEALRAGKAVERLYVAEGLRPNPVVDEITRRAKALRVISSITGLGRSPSAR